MKYFIAGWIVLVVLVISIAGFRGGVSELPPLEVFPDMDRQPKLRPQESYEFFPDGRSSRQPVAGTVSRGEAYQGLVDAETGKQVWSNEETPVTTGQERGSTNFVETIPVKLTAGLMERGEQRFNIYCAPCHGPVGDGNGVTKRLGMAVVANLHEPRIVEMPAGELFEVISNGRNLMLPYAAQISVEDRWAVIAYLRALQLTKLGLPEDLTQAERDALSGSAYE